MKNIANQILEMALMLGHTLSEEELLSKGAEETMPLETYLLERVFQEKMNPSLVKPILDFYRSPANRIDMEELIVSQIHYNYSKLQLTRKVQERFTPIGVHIASSLAGFIQEQAQAKLEAQAMPVSV